MKYISEKDLAKAGIVAMIESAGSQGLPRSTLTHNMPAEKFHYSWLRSKPLHRGSKTMDNPYQSSKRITEEAIDELLSDKIIEPTRTALHNRPSLSIADENVAQAIRRDVDTYLKKGNVVKQQNLIVTIGVLDALSREESLAGGHIKQALRGKYKEPVPAYDGANVDHVYTDVEPILEDMVRKKLLTEARINCKAARFSLTSKGRRALRAYAADPDTKPICEKFSSTPMTINVTTHHRQSLDKPQPTHAATEPPPPPENETARPYMSAFEAAKQFKDNGAQADPRDLHGILLAMEKEGSTDVRRVPTQSTQSGATTVLIKRSALGELERRYAAQQTARLRQ